MTSATYPDTETYLPHSHLIDNIHASSRMKLDFFLGEALRNMLCFDTGLVELEILVYYIDKAPVQYEDDIILSTVKYKSLTQVLTLQGPGSFLSRGGKVMYSFSCISTNGPKNTYFVRGKRKPENQQKTNGMKGCIGS